MVPLITTLALLSKFGITGSFAMIVLYTKELFPTTLRFAQGNTSNVNIIVIVAIYYRRMFTAFKCYRFVRVL